MRSKAKVETHVLQYISINRRQNKRLVTVGRVEKLTMRSVTHHCSADRAAVSISEMYRKERIADAIYNLSLRKDEVSLRAVGVIGANAMLVDAMFCSNNDVRQWRSNRGLLVRCLLSRSSSPMSVFLE